MNQNILRNTSLLLALTFPFSLLGAAAPQQVKDVQKIGAAQKKAVAEKQEKRTWKAKLGELAPDFELAGLDGKPWKLSDHRGKVVVLEWFNPTCPVVKTAHAKGGALHELGNLANEKGVVWVAINSNAPGKPGNPLRDNETARRELGMNYPILRDESGWVGRAYGASSTPHMFIIDQGGELVYAGAHDDAQAPNKPTEKVTNLIDRALIVLAGGGEIPQPRTKNYGCAVKYDDKAKLGQVAPDFQLTGLKGEKFRLSDKRGQFVVLEWFNPQCPVVKKAHGSGGPLEKTAAQVSRGGVVWAAINSGGKGKQGASRASNEDAVKRWNLTHPILFDQDGKVGKTFGARTTPQMFLIDPRGVIVYTGAAQARDGGPNFITKALSEASCGDPVSVPKTESYGCGVKYAN